MRKWRRRAEVVSGPYIRGRVIGLEFESSGEKLENEKVRRMKVVYDAIISSFCSFHSYRISLSHAETRASTVHVGTSILHMGNGQSRIFLLLPPRREADTALLLRPILSLHASKDINNFSAYKSSQDVFIICFGFLF